jgi:hypothetical protein
MGFAAVQRAGRCQWLQVRPLLQPDRLPGVQRLGLCQGSVKGGGCCSSSNFACLTNTARVAHWRVAAAKHPARCWSVQVGAIKCLRGVTHAPCVVEAGSTSASKQVYCAWRVTGTHSKMCLVLEPVSVVVWRWAVPVLLVMSTAKAVTPWCCVTQLAWAGSTSAACTVLSSMLRAGVWESTVWSRGWVLSVSDDSVL